MFIDSSKVSKVDPITLCLNNKCSDGRQRQRIIKREAWTATTLSLKAGYYGSFQESFSAHNSTLLLDKISDGNNSPAASRHVLSRRHKTSTAAARYREWLKYPGQSIPCFCALSINIKRMREVLYRTECITMMVFAVGIIDFIHVLETKDLSDALREHA